ncbi:transcriptional regulator [Flagellimonas aquimarina]|uniref:Transcriptional regulator n=1 Tax=Flagellimonas aquimarina TaxID=2201895 RepID=A0A316L5B0_9FLAO|nr:LysR family transcriptional regulator [Allomuricauda koreensis]PWL39453.1 transcriptional regulator [Allomuricauda koreensis]
MNYQIELRHFVYFLAVAEELHYRKAAEKLYISQPGLSTQIKQMEGILQTQLFIRDKKKVRLTPAGEFLKGEVEFILNHLEQTKKQLKLIGEGHLGEIRIGFLGSAMQHVIPNLLLDLKEKFPFIHTSLEELSNRAQISAILRDKLDLGFVRLSRVPKGLKLKPVFEDTFSLVLPADHVLNEKQFKSIDQVATDDFILFSQDYSPQYYDTVLSICEDAGFSPNVSHKSVHAQTVFKLVENKLGIAIVPTALQYGFQMKVKFIELKKIKQRAVLSMVWKEDNRNPALQNCMDLLLKL